MVAVRTKDKPMNEKASEPKTVEEMIASLKQGGGMTFGSTVKAKFLERIDEFLTEVDPTHIGAPDTLIFEVKELLPNAELTLTFEGQGPVNGRAERVTFTQRRHLRGMFWGEPDGFVFALGDKTLRLGGKFIQADTPEEEPAIEQEWRRLCDALNTRNRERGFKPLFPLETFPEVAVARCPECGTEFIPTRRGQVFDKRACADRAGQKRRRREKSSVA